MKQVTSYSDICVNGTFIRNVDLNTSSHSYTVDLGVFTPIDSSLEISFTAKEPGDLGIDYFLVSHR